MPETSTIVSPLPSRRLDQLDSLRGLAAWIVLVHHALIVIPASYAGSSPKFWWLEHTPLAVFRSGHESVMLFFVLSGFVLALPFLRGPVHYPSYLVRRICRIWIPYIVSCAVAILASYYFHTQELTGLSTWFNSVWSKPITGYLITQHILLLGSFDNSALNPILWSLVQELRLSIIFPLLMIPALRWRWVTTLLFAYGLSFFGLLAFKVTIKHFNWGNDYWLTLHIAGLFLFGIMIAKHLERLATAYRRLSRSYKICGISLALFAYTNNYWLLPNVHLLHLTASADWITAFAAGYFIVASVASPTISRFFHLAFLKFSGRISYSIYLYGTLTLITLIHRLFGIIPLPVIMLISLPVTLVLATISYYLIEDPCIRLGRYLSNIIVGYSRR